VREVRTPEMIERLEQLTREHPGSRSHRETFRRLGSEYVYARKLLGEESFRGSWIVLLRLCRRLEERFGISSEVPVIYSPHSDIQSRTVMRISEMLGYLPPERENYTRWLTFISSSDPRLAIKLDEFSDATHIYIPLSTKPVENLAEALIASLSRRIHSIDPYAQHGSVTGDQFFGRRLLLNSISANVKNQQIPAVFGMRKTGKTSVLKELERQNSVSASADREGDRVIYVYQDLEDLPDIDFGNPVIELTCDLAQKIRNQLGSAGFKVRPLVDITRESTLLDFKRAMQQVLTQSANKRLHLVIILDEIEYLCPPGAESAETTSTSVLVPQFFGVLRKLVQESSGANHTGARVSLILAGLASASVEARQLFGRENPLFSFAKPYYVSPLAFEDTTDLLRVLGSRHGLIWEDEAIALVHAETGGHAILVRELASQATTDLPDQGLELVIISSDHVKKVVPRYRRAVSSQIDQILSHIERFYKTEWELLELVMEWQDRSEVAEMAETYPSAVNRLENLGIIMLVDETWQPSKLLTIGWKNDRQSLRNKKAEAAKARTILDRIGQGESKHQEFKSTFSVPLHEGAKSADVKDAFLKVVISFFNSGGGCVYVGVADDGEILGIEADLKAAGGSTDKLTLQVQSALNSAVGKVLASRVSLSFPRVGTARVMLCEVPAVDKPVWPERQVGGKSDVLFVRQSANTQSLAGHDIVEYIRNQFPE
jgi:hypothetical protein